MHYSQLNVLPLSLCYQAYAMLLLVGCTGVVSACSVFLITVYGIGGVELVLAMCFVGFFGFVRLLLPRPLSTTTSLPIWPSAMMGEGYYDEYDDDNNDDNIYGTSSSYFTCHKRQRALHDLAVDTFIITVGQKPPSSSSSSSSTKTTTNDNCWHQDLVSSGSKCPICLEQYQTRDEVSTTQICRHTCHAQCLQMWVNKSPTCPYCRQDLEVRKSSSSEMRKGGLFGFLDALYS